MKLFPVGSLWKLWSEDFPHGKVDVVKIIIFIKGEGRHHKQ
jgi:hypothetical protein